MSETVTPACLFCQKALQGKRRHAAYCSSRCRVYASRKRYSLRESVTASPDTEEKRYSLRESVTVREKALHESVTPESVTAESVTPESVTPESVTAESVTPESVTAESVTPESVTLPHDRYWLDSKGQRWCSDCFPPVVGVALHDVPVTRDDARYEQEERLGIQDG